MKTILAYSAYFHDSSACLIQNGKIIAAIAEERLSRIKNDASFPKRAIDFCLEFAQISITEVDEVVFFEKPFTKFQRILESQLIAAPKGFNAFRKSTHSWLSKKFWIEDEFRKNFKTKANFSYSQHHFSHAALVCLTSNESSGTYCILDGVGELATISVGLFADGKLSPIRELHFPHSIGLLYSAFTQYCGFKVNSGEYKLMGLAPYGKPIYEDLIWNNFVSMNDKGELTLNLKNLGFIDDLQMINTNFCSVFGQSARRIESEMSQFYMDVAASIQVVTEKLILKLLNVIQCETKQKILFYGGGVALNCVANAKILEQTNFEKVIIHSASGDSGCALGAGLWKASEIGELNLEGNNEFLGPEFSQQEIVEILQSKAIQFKILDEKDSIHETAKLLAQDKVIGWFQGRSEFGPRALGNRSILANPMNPNMKSIINQKIKKREGFRPFAPVVLSNHFDDYFENAGYDYSKMLFVANCKKLAETIPSCVHLDNSARVQRLQENENQKLFWLLKEFQNLTNCPVLINTSFNERGEAMVNSPNDAISCFFNTEMDVLVLNNCIILKTENSHISQNQKTYDLD